ncbi:MAG: alpha/beta hydrolase [Acidimicrobiia bacterium]
MDSGARPVAPLAFPVGFESFNRRKFLNYQLNRAHALGFADGAELRASARDARSSDDCTVAMEASSTRAESEGRLRHAAGTLRIAEFFTPGRSPEKLTRYRRYRALFDAAFDDSGIVRHEVPYGNASLPAYRLEGLGTRRGTVLVHGGFDSLIEEFVGVWQRIAAVGFDVIAFDGPGQGGARRLGGLTFDHDWEKPVAAVLDEFGVETAGLVGISMGGYGALRAAGREPRIDRVVSWPPVYDWMVRVPRVVRRPAQRMLAQRDFMRWSIRTRARLIPTLRVVVDQALFNIDGHDPVEIVDWFLGMNAEHLGSERVTQDVLLLCGEHDAFQPPMLTRAQEHALVAARSVAVRTFTEVEHADQHCQMGNLELACRVITDWLVAPGPISTKSR